MLNLTAPKADHMLIKQIGERAMKIKGMPENYDQIDVELDVLATHANGCHLNLAKLLSADDFNFAHDIFGIQRHMDRKTGRLTHCFLPRAAR